MYKIKHIKDNQLNQVKLINSENNSYAKISLNRGASLQELIIKDKKIIEDLVPLKYTDTYASSILFPFANRIKDGAYSFNGKDYQFEINQKEEYNALHGLVYNKTFKILSEDATNNEASLTLEYEEANKSKGFPYTYTIQFKYTLKGNCLKLSVLTKNTDSKPFPYTIGWHPFFLSKNLYNSSLKFDSLKKVVLGERMITTGIIDYSNKDEFCIKDNKLDDCFILNSNKIQFLTPEYNMEMTSTSKETFLQIYTPPRANTIAIEPTTGVSNSFNNKIGLQVLEAGKTYGIDWEIKININK